MLVFFEYPANSFVVRANLEVSTLRRNV